MISVLSLNTWKCDGDYEKRLEIITAQLQNLNYSIIAIQECFATPDYYYNTAMVLSEKLGMNCFFYPCRRKPRTINNKLLDSFSGLAILCRFKVIQKHVIELPSTPLDPERVAIAVKFYYNNNLITLVNLHLTHLQNEIKLRNEQFKTVLNDPFLEDNDSINIFCGDFNCEVTSSSLSEFFNPPYKLMDTYFLGNGLQPVFTCPATDEINYDRKYKIDHILVAPKNNIYPQCIDSKIELNLKDSIYNIYPSDHFAIATKFIL